jgi:predicted SnoaL-like aldol condensation-catalyzing enzyme
VDDKSPRRIVERYNEDIWNAGKRGPITEIVANPLRRHHPGGTQVFTHEDMLKRFDGYQKRFPVQKVICRHYICEGPYVTLIWDFRFPQDGKEQIWSSIEIFKVEGGKITDVWNPNAIAETYPAGPWPEFER